MKSHRLSGFRNVELKSGFFQLPDQRKPLRLVSRFSFDAFSSKSSSLEFAQPFPPSPSPAGLLLQPSLPSVSPRLSRGSILCGHRLRVSRTLEDRRWPLLSGGWRPKDSLPSAAVLGVAPDPGAGVVGEDTLVV